MKSLLVLSLSNTSITDAGLARIGELEELRSLDLSRTKITDRGLSQLGVLAKLSELGLADTAVTDEGLKVLASLKGERDCFVHLDGTETSAVGRTLVAVSKEEQEMREMFPETYDLLNWDGDGDAYGNAPFLP